MACLNLILRRMKPHAGMLAALTGELATLVLQEATPFPASVDAPPWEVAAVVYACCRTACGEGWGHARVLTSLFDLPLSLLDDNAELVQVRMRLICLVFFGFFFTSAI